MILREFLYVDSDKVRGLLAQITEGIVESSAEVDKSEKLTGAGLKGIAEHSQRWGSERMTQKSQGDALFPVLESALEAHGLLRDISQDAARPQYWDSGELASENTPGSIIRVTAPGSLFDARYVANTLTAFATTWMGLARIGAVEATPAAKSSLKKGQQGSQVSRKPSDANLKNLEDLIPDEGILFGGGSPDNSISRDYLQGLIQVARGVYAPGLHLNLRPSGIVNHVVTARLQEGRQFLDGETDVLFARYGGGSQSWTLVGSIGHYGEVVDGEMQAGFDLTDANDNINRSVFAEMVNKLSRHLGTLGFVDLPQAPGFSMVPLAVYRTIGASQAPA